MQEIATRSAACLGRTAGRACLNTFERIDWLGGHGSVPVTMAKASASHQSKDQIGGVSTCLVGYLLGQNGVAGDIFGDALGDLAGACDSLGLYPGAEIKRSPQACIR